MQFKIGDNVVHPVYGVGHIVRIEEKKFSKQEKHQYEEHRYYEVILSNRTLWIPVDKAHTTIGLRLVTAKQDLEQYRDLLQSQPVPFSNNTPQQWHIELKNRLKGGTFPAMCEVVRDLTVLDWCKPLGATNKAILRKTQEKLCQEWATAADISVAEAAKEIETLLQVTQEKV